MPVINLLGNLVCPTYPAIYIVRSNGLGHGFSVDGMVGDIKDTKSKGWRIPLYVSNAINWAIATVCAAAPIAIIGGMSSFQSGSSTLPQRVWTMTWLALGSSLVIIVDTSKHILDARRRYLVLRISYEEELKKLVSPFKEIIGGIKGAEAEFNAKRNLIQPPLTWASATATIDTWELQKQEILGPARELANELREMPRGRLHKLELDDFKRQKMIGDLENLVKTFTMEDKQETLRKIWDIMQKKFLPSTSDSTQPVELESTRRSISKQKQYLEDVHPFQHRENDFYMWLGLLVVCGAPAIGGFVVVGQMIIDYGVCIRIA